ncbi:TIP41-like family protein [Actinidia rufa]|uniref:TIP41-like family protein n=1 Tax=Actinidia rufa TaxID=165716 RepID=A0A7J0EUY0_9ERIC|nr:TIP41-like family protein [Actinidia rufa]
MVFGDSSLALKHINSGTKIHFNAFDALTGWKEEALPPVEVPAAAKWKFRRGRWFGGDEPKSPRCRMRGVPQLLLAWKQVEEADPKVPYESHEALIATSAARESVGPASSVEDHFDEPSLPSVLSSQAGGMTKPFQQAILNYDYTFTIPYCGSETREISEQLGSDVTSDEGNCCLYWEDCNEQIDVAALASKEPILFYDEVILYEDELADNGVSLLTVKVRVMPTSWFLLLRFWLRVDGVLMRLRDTRMYCVFATSTPPIILREICWREATFQDLSAKGYSSDSAAYNDPSIISQRLPMIMHKTQKLKIPGNL